MRRLLVGFFAMAAMCGCQLAFSTVGSWTRAASPPHPVTTNNVVVLADGRIAIFGGLSLQTGQDSSQLTLFDPMSNTWTTGAPMPGPAFPDVVVRLLDGRVLLEGGQVRSTPVSGQTWLYDPVQNSWSRAGDLLEPRSGPRSTLLSDGRVLIAGGAVPLPQPAPQPLGGVTDYQDVPTAEIFDPETGKWTPAGRLAMPRRGFTLTALAGGGALAAGGCVNSNVFPTPGMSSADVFDPASTTWGSTTSLPAPMCGGTDVALRDGRVLLVDQSLLGNSSGDAFVYEPKSRTWTAAGGLAGGGTSAVLLGDGLVFVPEVQQGAPKGRVFIDNVGGQVFDPTTNQWTFATTTQVPLPLVYLYAGGTSLAVSLPDGRALVLLQTVTLVFHPEVAPPAAEVLDSTGLTVELVAALAVIALLLLLAYRRASRIELAKLQ